MKALQRNFEVRQNPSTVMQVSFNGSPIGSGLFAIAQTNPSLFIDSTGNAVALNQDGPVNSVTNPAKEGSDVLVFVNGDNFANNDLTRGLIVGAVVNPLYVPVAAFGYSQSLLVDSVSQQPGAIEGLLQIGLTLIVNGAEVGPFNGEGVQVYGNLWIAPWSFDI